MTVVKMSNEEIVEKIKTGCGDASYMSLLYQNNISLIKKIVEPYAALEDMEDLMQEAYLGLWEAVKHYDSSREVLFMSYATYWIKQAAISCVERSSLIRIPKQVQKLIRIYKKAYERLVQKYYREPTEAELAEEIGFSTQDLAEIKKSIIKYESLEKTFDSDEDLSLKDCIASEEDIEKNTTDRMYDKYQKRIIWDLAKEKLDYRDWRMIILYFKKNMSLIEIADKENISYQKARNMKQQAIHRLRLRAGKEYASKLSSTNFYHNSLQRFKETGSSNVEKMALFTIEINEKYENIEKGLSEI